LRIPRIVAEVPYFFLSLKVESAVYVASKPSPKIQGLCTIKEQVKRSFNTRITKRTHRWKVAASSGKNVICRKACQASPN